MQKHSTGKISLIIPGNSPYPENLRKICSNISIRYYYRQLISLVKHLSELV